MGGGKVRGIAEGGMEGEGGKSGRQAGRQASRWAGGRGGSAITAAHIITIKTKSVKGTIILRFPIHKKAPFSQHNNFASAPQNKKKPRSASGKFLEISKTQ